MSDTNTRGSHGLIPWAAPPIKKDHQMLQCFGEVTPEREGQFAPVNLQTVEADGTFTGYPSVFGQVDLA